MYIIVNVDTVCFYFSIIQHKHEKSIVKTKNNFLLIYANLTHSCDQTRLA